ncbi:MAG: hypothetical protein K5793_02765 [Nitrosarchaeum sp.]|nr:hypothetical protein [Nitrosarchaeum sp.]
MEWAQLHPNSKDMTSYEFDILDIIQKNPDIHHNALLKIAVPKYMAKKTAEKAVKTLHGRGLIYINKVGRHTQYSFNQGKEQINLDDLKKSVLIWSAFDELDVKNLKQHFSKISSIQKTSEALFQIQNALQNISHLSLIEALENPNDEIFRKEKLKFKKRIREIINIVRKDKDYKTVYPILLQILSSRRHEFRFNVERPEFITKTS